MKWGEEKRSQLKGNQREKQISLFIRKAGEGNVFMDPQAALLILKHCISFLKIWHQNTHRVINGLSLDNSSQCFVRDSVHFSPLKPGSWAIDRLHLSRSDCQWLFLIYCSSPVMKQKGRFGAGISGSMLSFLLDWCGKRKLQIQFSVQAERTLTPFFTCCIIYKLTLAGLSWKAGGLALVNYTST